MGAKFSASSSLPRWRLVVVVLNDTNNCRTQKRKEEKEKTAAARGEQYLLKHKRRVNQLCNMHTTLYYPRGSKP